MSTVTAMKTALVNPFGVQLTSTENCLANGPKFCVNVKPSRLDICSEINVMSNAVSQPAEKSALVFTTFKRMSSLANASYRTDVINFRIVTRVKKELEENEVKLLETDKSGLFTVLPSNKFQEKCNLTVSGLFRSFDGDLGRHKREIVRTCKGSYFTSLAGRLNGNLKDTSAIKFFLKEHKVDLTFRVVINEDGTWEKTVSTFLQNGLSCLDFKRPLALGSFIDLISDIQPVHGKVCTFSLDIKDLHYSLQPAILLSRVRLFLEENLVRFQPQSDIF